MKISALSSGGAPGADIAPPTSPRLAEGSVRSSNMPTIKMRTNASTNRHDIPQAVEEEVTQEEISTKPDDSGQTQAAVESTQPLSPQLADLAKQRRALQVKERELKEREAKLTQEPVKAQANTDEFVAKADLLSNPLKIFDLGLTYDQLTEAILADQNGNKTDPKALKEEILKSVKEDVEKRFVSQAEIQEEAALNQIADDMEALSKQGDTYEMFGERNGLQRALSKVYNHYKKTGQVLDIKPVMDEVENENVEYAVKQAKYKKVMSRIAPEPVQQPQSQGKQMKTLTNRDGAPTILDKRARAIAAMQGTLRK